jgi:hypothetical protein
MVAMSMLNLQASYFAIDNPLRLLDRWFNKFRHRETVRINQRDVEVSWTERAERALQDGRQPLIVELQLYFSCVVQKRVLFHEDVDFDTTVVNNRLEIAFRPIASAVCDPREFALSHPAGKDLSQGVAARMIPRVVEIDYRQGNWEGQFSY